MMGLRLLLSLLWIRWAYGSAISDSVEFFRAKKLPFVTAYICDAFGEFV